MKISISLILGAILCLALPSAAQNPCPGAQEHSLPLPTSVPSAQFVDYEEKFLDFLQKGTYKDLKWCLDKSVRDTGPFRGGTYYGTHPAVRIYYSPKIMQWLTTGRQGAIPDGAMIIKEQYTPPASDHTAPSQQATDWTIMMKDSKGSKDGWFWAEFFNGMTFDTDKFPFQYPWAGFGLYCVRCHAAAEKELTFSALRNIEGFPGTPIYYPDDHMRTLIPATNREGNILLESLTPGRNSNPNFLRTFNSIPGGVPFTSVQQMLSETYDNVPPPATGPGQFINSPQCESCHAGLNGPFGPTMFLPALPLSPPPPLGKIAGANVSPFGEWRWSPMGLAGRDPIFFSQLDSEFAYFNTLPPPRNSQLTTQFRNACITCHGAMGKRQLDTDSEAAGKGSGDFQLSFLRITDRNDPNFKYGGLARDGISCQVCHRNAPDQVPPGVPPLEYFLKNSITGHFPVSPANELYGPFKDNEISPYAMTTGTGITPKLNSYLQSSRMCGSCHTIDMPVVDSPIKGETRLEQATYLEWLNSRYQTEFGTPGPNAKSCGDCHMPTDYHNPAKGLDVPQIEQKMAIIEDETYPEADHRVPLDQINVRVRKEGYRRHEFLGLNVFLLEMFDQFNDVLGVRKDDYMSTSTTDLQDTIDNYVQQARSTTARLTTSATVTGPLQIQADVAVTNLTGHRFPSGVGFRRAFIELLVYSNQQEHGQQKVVWSSGRTNSLGVIIDGNGNPLPSEFFSEYTDSHGIEKQAFQPHYEIIGQQDQVQIYEELTRDAAGKFTTNFTLRDDSPKDNRLLPIGWTKNGPDPSLNGRFLHATYPEGNAANDPDYQDGKGTDHITYEIELPPGTDPATCRVQATLYYQSIPPYYLHQRFAAAPTEDATKRLYYLTSNLNVTGMAAKEMPVKNWKLPIDSATATPVTKR